jgi:hypothetical protein
MYHGNYKDDSEWGVSGRLDSNRGAVVLEVCALGEKGRRNTIDVDGDGLVGKRLSAQGSVSASRHI